MPQRVSEKIYLFFCLAVPGLSCSVQTLCLLLVGSSSLMGAHSFSLQITREDPPTEYLDMDSLTVLRESTDPLKL